MSVNIIVLDKNNWYFVNENEYQYKSSHVGLLVPTDKEGVHIAIEPVPILCFDKASLKMEACLYYEDLDQSMGDTVTALLLLANNTPYTKLSNLGMINTKDLSRTKLINAIHSITVLSNANQLLGLSYMHERKDASPIDASITLQIMINSIQLSITMPSGKKYRYKTSKRIFTPENVMALKEDMATHILNLLGAKRNTIENLAFIYEPVVDWASTGVCLARNKRHEWWPIDIGHEDHHQWKHGLIGIRLPYFDDLIYFIDFSDYVLLSEYQDWLVTLIIWEGEIKDENPKKGVDDLPCNILNSYESGEGWKHFVSIFLHLQELAEIYQQVIQTIMPFKVPFMHVEICASYDGTNSDFVSAFDIGEAPHTIADFCKCVREQRAILKGDI